MNYKPKKTTKPIVILPPKKEFVFKPLTARSENQKNYIRLIKQKDIVICLGCAGSGKTTCAVGVALEYIYNGSYDKIVITRPTIPACQESLGFLPGSFEDKINPFLRPIWDVVDDMLPVDEARIFKHDRVEICPLAYMRGRAGANSEFIITPYGNITFGEIKVGDYVIGSNGKPVKTIGVYPQGIKQIYRVVFSDKTEVRCSSDHLWSTKTLSEYRHNKGFSVKTTEQIAKTLRSPNNQKNHKVNIVSGIVEFEHKPIEIDPYLLGCLLGYGCMTHHLSFSNPDQEIIDEVSKRLPDGNKLIYNNRCDYRIQLINYINKSGLRWKKSHEKFIPNEYKYNSPEVRLEILQGLMDTNGSIFKTKTNKSRMQFYSTSKQLAEDVKFLVRSLGGYSYSKLRKFSEDDFHYLNNRIVKHNHNIYCVDIFLNITPFKLSRKAIRHINPTPFNKFIIDVIPCGYEECTCIEVDAQDHLFLANDFNITHNTHKNTIIIADEMQNASFEQLELLLTRLGENSKLILTGDLSQSDLPKNIQGGLSKVVDIIYNDSDFGLIELQKSDICRHRLVGRFLDLKEKYYTNANV